MNNKKIPTTEQIKQYRQMYQTATIQTDYDKINDFENEYDVFTKVFNIDTKKGVKDAAGEVLIPAIYDDVICTFSDPFRKYAVAVEKDNKMALVTPDGKGTPLTGFDYDSIHFCEWYYILVKDSKKGLATTAGNIIIPAEMDTVYIPFNNLVTFEKNGKYGFSMLGSDIVTQAIYDDFEVNESETLEVVKDGITGYLDQEGNFTQDEDDAYFHARVD